jgi:CRP/FNR family cyclic AMP-dependent transcriptional regulator
VQQVTVNSEDKVDLFRERGLSATEMKLLATFSSEERFREGSMIFREGERGDKLYIVLDGRVRISKFFPAWAKKRWPSSTAATSSARWR